MCHNDCNSCFPVHCLHYQDHHHWQNLHPLQENKQTCQKQLRPTQSPAHRTTKPLDFTITPPFNRLGDTFPKKLMRITWIISRLCVQRRSCRSGFCFARGRLPALLSVSSGSCGLWCFLPVVIESDQFSLMTRTQIVMLWLSCYGFLIKDVTTVTCYNHYKLLCLQKHNVKLQSFCWGESLSECGRNFCHIVSSLWWSVSVGSNRRQNKLNDIQTEHYYKQELSINMQLIYLVKLVICFLKHVAVTDAMLLQRCIILDSIWRTI